MPRQVPKVGQRPRLYIKKGRIFECKQLVKKFNLVLNLFCMVKTSSRAGFGVDILELVKFMVVGGSNLKPTLKDAPGINLV